MAEPACLALTNLNFEYELAAGPKGRPVALPQHFGQRWQWILRLLPQARQAECLDPTSWKLTTARSAGRLVVWGVTPQTNHLAGSLGLSADFPPVDLVRELNDKRFSHQLERELGIELPHSQVIESLAQFRSAVNDCPYAWVLKHPLGFSARERVLGQQGQISDSAWGWARRKLGQSWTLLFEPWVEQRRDFSLHFEIDRQAAARFVGHCQLVGDPGGVYRGNRVIPSAVPDRVALECGHQVADVLARRGYWGALGIDAFAGVLGERPLLRPLVEINARCSFGRLALALGDWIPEGWCYLWWHPGRSQSWQGPLTPLGAADPKPGAYALPLSVDPTQNSGTVVIMAPTPDALEWIETGARARFSAGHANLTP